MPEQDVYTPEQIQKYFDLIKLPSAQRILDVTRLETDELLNYLTVVQKHQLCTIPFENLSLHYATHYAVSIEPEHLFRKMVDNANGRGGYCMENNTFFGTILRSLGFTLYAAGAKVKENDEEWTGWSHMVLLIAIGDLTYMVDVGFGNNGPTQPMPLKADTIIPNITPASSRLTYKRIEPHSDPKQRLWVYEHSTHSGDDDNGSKAADWTQVYCFTDVEFTTRDFAIMNHYTSTARSSWFTYEIMVVKFCIDEEEEELDGCLILGQGLKKRRHGKSEHLVEKFESEAQRIEALEKYFGIFLLDEEKRGIKLLASSLEN